MGSEITYIGWLGSVLGLLCLVATMVANRRRRLIADLPTSKTIGVFIGLVELKGTAESEHPLTSYLAAVRCVLYSWSVEEHWSRTVTETYRDSQGRTQTRTRHESGWATVAKGGEMAPFYLQDDEGVILVRPTGADIDAEIVFNTHCRRADPLYYGKGPTTSVANSDHRRRFTERAIPLHHRLYVLGQSQLRDDVVAPEVAAHDDAPLYLISVRDEQQIQNGYAWGIYLWWIVGLVLSAGGWLIAHNTSDGLWTAPGVTLLMIPSVLAVLAYLAATALGWVWMVYNSLVELRLRVKQGWSQVEVQLRRRHDLIPSLAAAVKGLSAYEKDLQVTIAELRAQTQATAPGKKGADYHGYAKQLMAVAEHYPELKANESFLKLQKEITETENRVALARGYFNEVAAYYNARIEVVPERFVAGLTGMRKRELMEASDFERAPVDVTFEE